MSVKLSKGKKQYDKNNVIKAKANTKTKSKIKKQNNTSKVKKATGKKQSNKTTQYKDAVCYHLHYRLKKIQEQFRIPL